jgi:hypothetical protein
MSIYYKVGSISNTILPKQQNHTSHKPYQGQNKFILTTMFENIDSKTIQLYLMCTLMPKFLTAHISKVKVVYKWPFFRYQLKTGYALTT